MSRNRGNQGIQGNVVNYGAMSVGTSSRAQQNVLGQDGPPETLEQLREQMENLTKAIQEHSASLQNAPQLLSQMTQANAELQQKQPSRNRLSGLMESVTGGLASVSALAKAAGVLKAAVVALL
jgi:chromosome segregation ATPase